MHKEGKVIRAPLIVAGEIPERLYAVCPLRILARSPATDKDGYPLEHNSNLWGTTEFIRLGDLSAQHIDIPSGGRVRVLTDDMDVLKNEVSSSHNSFPFLAHRFSTQLAVSFRFG